MEAHRQAKVGDLVIARTFLVRSGPHSLVGQVVRQTDIMSEVLTTIGSVLTRTSGLEVVQPAHLDHTQGRRQA